jgi:hypothetical protein
LVDFSGFLEQPARTWTHNEDWRDFGHFWQFRHSTVGLASLSSSHERTKCTARFDYRTLNHALSPLSFSVAGRHRAGKMRKFGRGVTCFAQAKGGVEVSRYILTFKFLRAVGQADGLRRANSNHRSAAGAK